MMSHTFLTVAIVILTILDRGRDGPTKKTGFGVFIVDDVGAEHPLR
jgi:hypothetical protein